MQALGIFCNCTCDLEMQVFTIQAFVSHDNKLCGHGVYACVCVCVCVCVCLCMCAHVMCPYYIRSKRQERQ